MPRVQFQYSINIAGSASQKWGLAGEKAVLLIDAEWERGGSAWQKRQCFQRQERLSCQSDTILSEIDRAAFF